MIKRTSLVALIAISTLLMSACGGGGGDSPAATNSSSKAEGVYEGTLSGSSSSVFQLLVLENDEYWGLYGSQVGNTFGVRGFIQGQGTSNNGSFTSANAKDFGTVPPTSGTITASYVANASLNGSVASSAGSATFSGTSIAPTNYNYNVAAAVGEIAGNWTLGALDGSTVTLSVAAGGSFTANSAGCAITGTFTPRASGKNVFDVALTFGGAPCALPGTAGAGVALTYPTAVGTHQLIVAGVDPARTAGTALFGTR